MILPEAPLARVDCLSSVGKEGNALQSVVRRRVKVNNERRWSTAKIFTPHEVAFQWRVGPDGRVHAANYHKLLDEPPTLLSFLADKESNISAEEVNPVLRAHDGNGRPKAWKKEFPPAVRQTEERGGTRRGCEGHS